MKKIVFILFCSINSIYCQVTDINNLWFYENGYTEQRNGRRDVYFSKYIIKADSMIVINFGLKKDDFGFEEEDRDKIESVQLWIDKNCYVPENGKWKFSDSSNYPPCTFYIPQDAEFINTNATCSYPIFSCTCKKWIEIGKDFNGLPWKWEIDATFLNPEEYDPVMYNLKKTTLLKKLFSPFGFQKTREYSVSGKRTNQSEYIFSFKGMFERRYLEFDKVKSEDLDASKYRLK
jgi:hypothetical protein